MAEKPRKKNRHTSLVVPGEEKKKKPPRKQRESRKKVEPPKEETQVKQKPEAEQKQEAEQPQKDALPSNAIPLPAQNPLLTKYRRKKLFRRLRFVAVLVLVGWLVLFFASGAYLTAWVSLQEAAVNVQVAVQPGEGFPAAFSIAGYQDAQSMEDGGFAILGEKEMGIVSSTGRELLRVQHSYISPQMCTSKNRVCVYNRGGSEYMVTRRTGEFYSGAASNSILFANLSPGGNLALCTASRTRYTLEVLNSTLEWQFTYTLSSNDIPLSATFHTDDKTIALACVAPGGGSMNGRVYILNSRAWNEDRVVLGEIRADGVIPLQVHFLTRDRILVLYNQGYAAVYNTAGEELYRYPYENRTLQSADVHGGAVALVFGSAVQDVGQLVTLNNRLEPYASVELDGVGEPSVLLANGTVFVLNGQEVWAHALEGEQLGQFLLEGRALGLVYGGTPLAITSDEIQDLQALLNPPEEPVPAPSTSAQTDGLSASDGDGAASSALSTQ